MRVVLYDDESLEPITVVDLPLTERDMLQRRIWRVPVPEWAPLRITPSDELTNTPVNMRVVVIEFEQFVRRSPRHGEQRSIFAFTQAADLAMLLNPAWLPGQWGAIQYLQDQNDALTRMLMRAYEGP